MTNRNFLLLLILTLSLLSGCGVSKKYDSVKSINSIVAYENYIAKYPKSKYLQHAKDELITLYEERDWSSARSANTVYGYNNFLSKYPYSKYGYEAELKIFEIKEQNAWNKTKTFNTIFAYENFIASFPESKYVFDAELSIQSLYDDNGWSEAVLLGTVESYRKYLFDFPNGSRKGIALELIKQNEIIQPKWDEALRINTVSSYRKFLNLYPNSSYSATAKQKLNEYEAKHWKEALKANSIKNYLNYITNFPDGKHIATAEKKIIDIEVDNILKGNYGKLPPMSKTTSNYYAIINEIEIFNDTNFTLTVRYSGDFESKKIVILPKQKTKLTISNGDYRVAASVDAKNVKNYAGKEKLEGGSYSSVFYIKTITYRE